MKTPAASSHQRLLVPPVGHLADANHLVRHPAEAGTWVWHPDSTGLDTAVLRFRLTLHLSEPLSTIIHITADQRFQLRCDGRDISFGPDRCDLEHWTVQTLPLDLPPGDHELEVLAWHIAQENLDLETPDSVRPPMAQMSLRGGFLLFAENTPPALLNTGTAPWTVENLTPAISLKRPGLPGYHDIGPEFTFDLATWNHAPPAKPESTCPPLRAINGVRRPGWCLHPATLPEQQRHQWQGGKIRATRPDCSDAPWQENNAPEWQNLIDHQTPITLPAHSEITILWDFETYHCGYPQLTTSGGRDTLIHWSWAEALYQEPSPDKITPESHKGHRTDITNKVFLGIEDTWLLAGTDHQQTPALWWRSGRFVRIRIRTQNDPLTIEHLAIQTTGYPLGDSAPWKSSDPQWDHLMHIFVHSFRMAAHETWTDSPYYEQMSYTGDTALTCLSNYALFRDDALSRRAIELFDWSRRPSGLVTERYPCAWRQESTTYALIWPGMVRDHALWRDNPQFIRDRLPGLRSLLAEVEALTDENLLLRKVPGWSFIDWVPAWVNGGFGPGVAEGDSSIVNLHWVNALLAAAQVEEMHGDPRLAARNLSLAKTAFARIIARYWDPQRNLLLDTPGCPKASEHAQMFALLTGLLDPEKTAHCLAALQHPDDNLSKATIYASFYVLEALAHNHADTAFHTRLGQWRDLLKWDFSCTPEQPEPTRSDCHAWGSHPAWHTMANIAGVRPAAAGFAKVRIRPNPGPLTTLACAVQHPKGIIALDLQFTKNTASGTITLPETITGEFLWNEKTHTLQPGENTLTVH